MSLPSIVSTQSPSVSGVFVGGYGHYKKDLSLPRPSTPATSTDSSATAAEPLASAIAAALTQLGLIPNASVAGTDNAVAASDTSSASLSLPQSASPQIQQYRSMASASSNLAQALSASANSASPATNGAGQLTAVFQSLWTSLGSPSGTATNAAGNAMPSLQSFLETLARHFSESGVSGLRGVFVDTVV